jgi:WD40 repeat protein
LVEVGTGKLFPLPGLVGTLRGWSADSRWLAISTEKRLDVWDVAQAKLHTQIKANEERTHLQFQLPRVPVAGPWQPAWSPRSQSVVLCEYQSSALVVGLDTEWKVVPLVGSSRWYNWSPDGRLLATGCRESPGAMLWDGQTGQPSKALPGKGPAVSEVAFSPDGARLAAVQGAEGVAIYDVAQRSLLTTLATEQRGVVGVLWSPDSRRLAAADGKRIVVWDLGADGAPPASLEGHTGDVRCLDWSPDSTAIASGGGEGEVRIWDVAQRTCRQTLRPQKQTAVDRLCWSPTGARLATEAGFVIEVWEIASGNAVGSFHARPGMLNSWLTVFAWSPDGNALAAGFTQWLRGTEMLDNALAIWQAASGQWIGIKPEPNPGFLLARSQGPAMLRWAADGRRLTCAHYDNTLRSYDAATGAALDRVSAYPRATCVVQLAVAPNGRFAAASTSDWHAVLWNAESGEPLGAVRLFANCGYLQVSADGRYRASPEIEKQIVYVVQTAAGQETLAPAEFAERFGWKNDPPARDPH